jgi:hypothetical protein
MRNSKLIENLPFALAFVPIAALVFVSSSPLWNTENNIVPNNDIQTIPLVRHELVLQQHDTSSVLTEKEIIDVLSAIRIVESNNNPNAVGDSGNAIGIYQIWSGYHKDALEVSDIGGNYSHCFNPDYADRVVRAYMLRYATERRIGRAVTQQDIARIHNGGPNGWRKTATLKYWEKVKKELGSK